MGKDVNTTREEIRAGLDRDLSDMLMITDIPGDSQTVLAAAIAELEEEKDPTRKGILGTFVSGKYLEAHNYIDSEKYSREVIKNEDLPGSVNALAYSILSVVCARQAVFEEVDKFTAKALELVDKDNPKVFVRVLNALATVNVTRANYPLGSKYGEMAVELLEKQKDKIPLLVAYLNLALSLELNDEIGKAKQVTLKAEKLGKKVDRPDILSAVMISRARLALYSREFNDVLKIIEEALSTFDVKNNPPQYFEAMVIRAHAYLHLEEYQNALKDAEELFLNKKMLKIPRNLGWAHLIKGRVLLGEIQSFDKNAMESLFSKADRKGLQLELKVEELKRELKEKQRELEDKYGYTSIIGMSEAILKTIDKMESVAQADIPVVIYGESGTGKDLAAKAIHYNSSRKNNRFVAINCREIPETLLVSELFGYEKGAFTGANEAHQGLFEAADKGTLFLDDISNMSLEMQMKLLRVLQEGEIRRVGANKPIKVDVRIISSSNVLLEDLIASGAFREDLYYRLQVISIKLPPLRDRIEDIPLLVEHFWQIESGKEFDAEEKDKVRLYKIFSKYAWPGNIRELENEIKRLVHLGNKSLDLSVVSEKISESKAGLISNVATEMLNRDVEFREAVQDFEKQLIRLALKEKDGVKKYAAKRLGIPLTTLYDKIEKYKIRYRKGD